MIDRRRALAAGVSFLAGSGYACAAPDPRPTDAPGLRRGVNIHHVLNWPQHQRERPVDYVWPPFADPPHGIGSDTLSALSRAGFSFVRLTLDPAIFMASDGPRRETLVGVVLSRLHQMLAAGFEVVLDLHPVAENPTYAPAQLTMPGSPALAAYLETVTLLAGALKTLPPDRVALELMNEPQPAGADAALRWQQMLERLHAAARGVAPNLALVLTGANWSAAQALTAVDISPFRGGNVLYTFHYYEPHIFTHQGVANARPERYFEGLLWPPQQGQLNAMTAQLRQKIMADPAAAANAVGPHAEKVLADYMSLGDGAAKIRDDFALVGRWAKAKGVPPERILLGEFGANQSWPESPAQRRSRIDWLTAIRQAAEAEGFGWAYWALKDGSGSPGGFRLSPAGAETGFDADVLHALFGHA